MALSQLQLQPLSHHHLQHQPAAIHQTTAIHQHIQAHSHPHPHPHPQPQVHSHSHSQSQPNSHAHQSQSQTQTQPLVSQTKLMVNFIPEQLSQEGLQTLFGSAGRVHSCRLVANRGYGFVEFTGPEEAERARAAFDGLNVHGKALKVAFALLNPEPSRRIDECNLYVTNLPADTSLETLNTLFRPSGTITNSRVAHGVGFVRFETRKQAEDAITRLNGVSIAVGTPPLTVKFALKGGSGAPSPLSTVPPRPPQPVLVGGKALPFLTKGTQRYNPMAAAGHALPLLLAEPSAVAVAAAGRTTVYVYNIGDDIDELTLWQLFGPYGAIDSIKVIKDAETKKNRGFAFVNMRDYEEAAQAIRALNGYTVNGQVLSVSFKTQKRK